MSTVLTSWPQPKQIKKGNSETINKFIKQKKSEGCVWVTRSPRAAALLPWVDFLDEDRVVLYGSLHTVGQHGIREGQAQVNVLLVYPLHEGV